MCCRYEVLSTRFNAVQNGVCCAVLLPNAVKDCEAMKKIKNKLELNCKVFG